MSMTWRIDPESLSDVLSKGFRDGMRQAIETRLRAEADEIIKVAVDQMMGALATRVIAAESMARDAPFGSSLTILLNIDGVEKASKTFINGDPL